ncbi:diacylglycerol kinase [Pseudohongiella sp. SYSU M77423]|uniref:diacylglycerol kinase n=1 Tax=Pseudohongiella sp. SYSU M77423 TaxID=3042312 RepID=UPI0024803A63|nr:diacylglycerol kinase [Pseudohongiella sp. SYSU M77423]MDH7943838.1 diacylglycerol kinase [Pseudohongiella sp. SYSU M77423]MEC8861292.1 diacylglycerol kinase [Pseudomonadota bacterium]
MKSEARGVRRLIHATRFSMQGLKALWRSEEAFRMEVILVILLTPVIIMVDVTPAERALLVGSLLIVLLTEMLNSAIEVAIDRIGHEYHELSGRAKDMGSAAVLFSLIGAAIVWAIILWPF